MLVRLSYCPGTQKEAVKFEGCDLGHTQGRPLRWRELASILDQIVTMRSAQEPHLPIGIV